MTCLTYFFHCSFLQADEVLRDLWFQYVPKKMKELEFWRRYFIAVKRLRQEVINSDSENSVGRSWSNIERRLTFGGIGNEVRVAYWYNNSKFSSMKLSQPCTGAA
jgi:hypothetical protein